MEVGVWDLPYAQCKNFLYNDKTKIIMVEPLLNQFNKIKNAITNFDDITLHNKAVYKTEGTLEINVPIGTEGSTASSYIESGSPYDMNDKHDAQFTMTTESIETVTMDMIDDGDLDVLAVDAEGCEWYVLETMKSRPKVITLETGPWIQYINPKIDKINEWMKVNGYAVFGREKSDTIYYKITSRLS
jgi:FkbM family methyltransferase